MTSSNLWIADAPFVEGQFGTGPVDLSLATQALSGPTGFDLPGGAGDVLDRAYRWFVNAANAASSQQERADLIVNAARALNNLAVWSLTRRNGPDVGDAAMDAFREADRLLGDVSVGGAVRGGVYFNLGQLATAAGAQREATHYLGLAQSFGFDVSGVLGADNMGAPTAQTGSPDRSDDVRLDHEPADVMQDGKTQLMFWSAVGDEDCVRALISRGADLDVVDDDGDTALLYAVSKGHGDIAKLLLRHGADPNICGDSGVPIRLAASRGWTEMVRMLAARGARVDAPSIVMGTAGVTAVMVAAGGGSVECLRALLDLGANPDLVDSDGDSALFYAQSNGQTATAALLLSTR